MKIKVMDWSYIRHFEPHEFDSPDAPDSWQQMNLQFVERLDNAREAANVPFEISSGYRTEEHNAQVGGVPDSAHRKGLAVDIEVPRSRDRFYILHALLDEGFHRIGIGPDFIHVDNDKSKDEQVIWTYYE